MHTITYKEEIIFQEKQWKDTITTGIRHDNGRQLKKIVRMKGKEQKITESPNKHK